VKVVRAFTLVAGLCLFVGTSTLCAQSPPEKATVPTKPATPTPSELERQVFAIVREADALRFLGYVPEDGANLGHDAVHTNRAEIEEQLTHHTGLYCKLFDSSCLPKAGEADPSPQICSYRELLTQSEKVRTASTETTRNNVRQAILVAEVQNAKCGGHLLIDFIFNHQHDGWKLFSIP
jgi:hypothetical protein